MEAGLRMRRVLCCIVSPVQYRKQSALSCRCIQYVVFVLSFLMCSLYKEGSSWRRNNRILHYSLYNCGYGSNILLYNPSLTAVSDVRLYLCVYFIPVVLLFKYLGGEELI